MTNNDVTTLLFVQFVAYFSKSLDRIGTGDYLQLHPSNLHYLFFYAGWNWFPMFAQALQIG
ncbi:MAG TPA: hypothetical protein VNX88_23615 [Terriglobales bacterium]|jgi:hypothetical protein|nr:hypothetical protein [Terriglobales bacterium]